MDKDDWFVGLDLDMPSPARVYDYFLGGSHNFDCDRAMARKLEQAMPDIGEIMRSNRAFLRRAVRFLVDAGIRQFLDLGSGVPTVGNVHEVAQQDTPDAAVVYVDIDPVAVAHSTSLLAGQPRAGVVRADLRDTAAVLGHPTTRTLLDLTRPVAVLMVGVLHQLPGGEALDAIRRYRELLVPGSYLVLSQASADERPAEARDVAATFNRGYGPGTEMTLRPRADVAEFFAGFELVEPGLVHLRQWRPETGSEVDERPERQSTYAGVGRRVTG